MEYYKYDAYMYIYVERDRQGQEERLLNYSELSSILVQIGTG